MPQRPPKLAVALLVSAVFLACDDEPTDPHPDTEAEPTLDVAGFRIMHGDSVKFEYRETDPLEADTLHLYWPQAIVVRFVWLDGAGDSLDVGEHQLIVTTADERFATFERNADTSYGLFSTGGFPEVETSFTVRLVAGGGLQLATRGLVLDVSKQ